MVMLNGIKDGHFFFKNDQFKLKVDDNQSPDEFYFVQIETSASKLFLIQIKS